MSYSRQEFRRMEKLRIRWTTRRHPLFWVVRLFIALVALFVVYGIALQLLGLS
jgi:hypothetical protein